MSKRKIIKIDEKLCDGCGQCLPNCPEGAIQVIDGKARLISDLFCDGLGACLGHCPQGAISIEEREAEEYDERKVMANIIRQGPHVIQAHLAHLREHRQDGYWRQAVAFLKENNIPAPAEESASAGKHQQAGQAGGCPGARVLDFRGQRKPARAARSAARPPAESQLRQWPVQLMLVPPFAPCLNQAHLLIAADCVPFAYAAFHEDLLKGRTLLVGCPKLDDLAVYRDKLARIFKTNEIKSVVYAHMEVPCCFGLTGIIQEALAAAGKNIPFKETVISIAGEKISE